MTNQYKVGVLYCKEGQSTEEEMYNNRKLNHQLSVYFWAMHLGGWASDNTFAGLKIGGRTVASGELKLTTATKS